MSSAANTFLRLNSTVSQPGSPTSLKGAERVSMVGSVGAGGATSGIIGGTQSITGAGNSNGRTSRCGSACWRYLSSNPRLRKGLAHAGLVLLLCFYTAAGASVRRVAINKTVLLLYSVRRVRSMVTAIYFPLFPEPDENGDNREFIPSSVCL